jgi:Ca2+-binding RTX toxin-like protein
VTPVNDTPVVDPIKTIWMADEIDNMVSPYQDGYPLYISAPTDIDGDALTITVTAVPANGQIGYMDGGSFIAVESGDVLIIDQLTSLVYRPDDTYTFDPETGQPIAGADSGVFTYSVGDGTVSVAGTVNINTLLGSGAHADVVKIGDGSSPLTSGNDQTANLLISSQLAAADPYLAALVLVTDFQKAPFTVPIPQSDQNDSIDELENTVTVSIVVDGIEFIAILENDGADQWAINSDGLWQTSVSLDTVYNSTNATQSLADYLTSNPASTGDTWTLIYNDSDGGNYQARYVEGTFIDNIEGNPAITIPGGTGIDIEYGTAYNDSLTGQGGNDILVGGSGDDALTGGLGADSFVWNAGNTGHDSVSDFSVAQGDTLNVADLLSGGMVMSAVAESGHLQLQFSDGGSVVQTIDLTNIAVANNTEATNLMNQLLTSNNIVD